MAIMSNTQMPPSPVDPSTVGPRAHALIACIRQAGIKASEADRAAQTLENIASTSVRFGVCQSNEGNGSPWLTSDEPHRHSTTGSWA